MTVRRKDSGVSLLELTAVLAIFSVLALLSVQLLSQGITSRDRLSQTDNRLAELTSAIAVLRRDFEHLAPLPQDNGATPRLRFGVSDVTLATPDMPLVTWQFDPGAQTLSRETPSGRLVLLHAVSGITWQTFTAGRWQPAEGWSGTGPAALPRGISATLSLADLGDVPVVIAR